MTKRAGSAERPGVATILKLKDGEAILDALHSLHPHPDSGEKNQLRQHIIRVSANLNAMSARTYEDCIRVLDHFQ